MKVNSLEIESFRNIENMSFKPCNTINIIYGENAQGKTNLLEAMWLFTGCRSFRGSKDRDFLKFDSGSENGIYAKLFMSYSDEKKDHSAEMVFSEKKKTVLDGVEQSSAASLFGEFYGIVFAPQHLSLIKGGPLERRRFLNQTLCQLKPKYERVLSDYVKILDQRNALLKDLPRHSELLDTLFVWDEKLAEYSAVIMLQRLRYIEEMMPYLQNVYSGLSGGRETIRVFYESPVVSDGSKPEELKAAFKEVLKASLCEDIHTGVTSVGPHRDDMIITLDGMPVKSFGSQGQQRSCALALKLSEAAVIRKITGCEPVVFLDDVMSELDSNRQDFILNHIEGRQVFITCCDPSSILRSKKGEVFEIKGGRLCSST